MCPGLSSDLQQVNDSRKTAIIDRELTRLNIDIAPHRRVSWRHPRSRHWHQLDLVITRRPSLNCVLTTCSYHSADCDTDHSMVGSEIRLQPKRIHQSKQEGRPRINTSKTAIPDLCERFTNSIEDALKNCPGGNTEERWSHIHDFIYNSAMDTFGKRERQNPDWFEAGIAELEPAIEAKRAALINHKREPSVKSLAALRKARNDAQRIVRRCANDYWISLCESIQLSADCGNIRGIQSEDGVYIHTRSDGSLFKLARLRAKIKVR
ncbi:uncharacterized protein LOC119585364 [Penaeus monodon]|uniref:uncharacterized protein LOC119585364 n=1 Tax=Penaeus monodon TaxID=6687 RepID=UPI0018A75110|nr:uncharacterized protein LOC119585364 [Penaeus monodon]